MNVTFILIRLIHTYDRQNRKGIIDDTILQHRTLVTWRVAKTEEHKESVTCLQTDLEEITGLIKLTQIHRQLFHSCSH